jgi:hypothetical protein
MEDSKLQALHDTLEKLRPGRKGLGSKNQYSWQKNQAAGDQQQHRHLAAASLPDNALYANFIPEGTYDPSGVHDGDGRVIKRNFSDAHDSESTSASSSEKKRRKKRRKEEKKATLKAEKLEAKRKAKQGTVRLKMRAQCSKRVTKTHECYPLSYHSPRGYFLDLRESQPCRISQVRSVPSCYLLA